MRSHGRQGPVTIYGERGGHRRRGAHVGPVWVSARLHTPRPVGVACWRGRRGRRGAAAPEVVAAQWSTMCSREERAKPHETGIPVVHRRVRTPLLACADPDSDGCASIDIQYTAHRPSTCQRDHLALRSWCVALGVQSLPPSSASRRSSPLPLPNPMPPLPLPLPLPPSPFGRSGSAKRAR